MENMRPGNSFPQICVVSVNKSVENNRLGQDYRRSMDVSNLSYDPKVTSIMNIR